MITLTLTPAEIDALQALVRRLTHAREGYRCSDNLFLVTGEVRCERRDKGHTVHEAWTSDALNTHHFTWERNRT